MAAWTQQAGLANAAILAAFGQPVSYQRAAGGAPFPITGILHKATDEERQQDGVFVRLFVNLTDFGARPEKGDLATVNGTTYTIFEVVTDLAGGATISMKKHG